jgi:hypothetical protein
MYLIRVYPENKKINIKDEPDRKWTKCITVHNGGHITIDDDDVPRDKEVAAKENEAIFDSLSPT